MSSPFTQLSSAVNYYVKNICKANNASGVVGTVPVLYYGPCIYIISTIRSIIDYAAPVLVSLPQKSLQHKTTLWELY